MLRTSVCICLCTFVGCARAGLQPVASRPSASPRVLRAPDHALELVAQLPAGADRCVVARPSRLPGARRILVARISQADALAWIPELEVMAFAGATREHRNAPPGQVSLLWVAAAPERVRARLDASGAQPIDWGEDGHACGAGGCEARARWLGPHVLRIERGDFANGSAPGVELHCAQMAARDGEALELGFTRSRVLLSMGLGVLPLTSSSELTQTQAGLHVGRSDLMRSIADAGQAVGDRAAADVMLGPVGALGSNLRRRQQDAAVRTEYDVLWEDLELARDDETRMRAAEREADALERAQPDLSQAPARREDVLAQLGYRLELMRAAAGDERRTQAKAARALLEGGLARDPGDEGLALMLAELLLTELGDAELARDIARRFGSRPGAQSRWTELRHHAAALLGVAALANALIADRVGDRNKARAIASDIVARLREGASYGEAERSVLAQSPR
jgi:hypothetical protein